MAGAEAAARDRRLAALHRHLGGPGAPPLLRATACKAAAPVCAKLCSAEAAVALIKDDSWLTVQGFVGAGGPEALTDALRARFDATARPRGLSLLVVASVGDGKGRGMDRLAAEGLLAALVFGWIGNCPSLARLVRANAVAAHNVPLGVASHMIRDVAAGRVGPVTAVGVGTFVDPRRGGGRLNTRTAKDAAEVVRLGGRERLWYRAPPALDAALLRGSSADADGNVSFEREALPLDALNQAMAARNSGGVVIVQVERLVPVGALPTRAVVLPACLVDRIVVAPPHLHWQTLRERLHHLTLSGEARGGAGALAPLPRGARRAIALRALRELDAPCLVVNLGVGMPEGVASAVAELKSSRPLAASATLTTEAGAFGGSPAPGLAFGASHSADAHVPTASMIDFYNGGGVDVAVLGMAEVDSPGCVNVSSFEGRLPGCGGFIDISQNSKRLIFVGTFTSGGLEIEAAGGRLRIIKEGRHRKFVERVREVTFSSAHKRAERVLYVTERAVFRLLPGGAGLELCEVAPGVDAERDVLALMGFRPAVADPLPLMAAECFE